jgi:hypothetical protein
MLLWITVYMTNHPPAIKKVFNVGMYLQSTKYHAEVARYLVQNSSSTSIMSTIASLTSCSHRTQASCHLKHKGVVVKSSLFGLQSLKLYYPHISKIASVGTVVTFFDWNCSSSIHKCTKILGNNRKRINKAEK